jgi:hypothetical protein
VAFTKWSQIRDEQIERIGCEEFEAGKEQLLVQARGWRLAEIRRRRGCGTPRRGLSGCVGCCDVTC